MRKKRIMVVEDEGITAIRMLTSLKEMGYSVESPVFSGEEAVKKAAEMKPDLVLMDITLRGEMDGIIAAGHIYSRYNIPVVYVTAISDEKMLKRIKDTVPYGYIIKPFDDHELRISVELALYKYEMEARLKESEARYRTLFKNANDAIYLVDPETQRIVDCNPKAAKISGYTIRELKSLTIGDLFPLAEQGIILKILEKIRAQGTLSDIWGINQMERRGTLVPVEINAATIKLKDKKYILYIARDISERRRVEEALRESEERFHILFDQSSDSIVIFDAGSEELIQFNNRACENLGYTREEFAKLKMSDIEVEDLTHNMSMHMAKIKQKGECSFETRHKTKSGEIRDVLINTKVIRIRENEFIQSTWIDITERKKVERQLSESVITDDLTGLLNRRGFFALAEQQIKLANRNKKHVCLLYLDIDGFKNINDERGHKAGDNALIDTARILRGAFRKSDIIGRIGGDEFVVLLTDPSEPDRGDVVVKHLNNRLKEFNMQGQKEYKLMLSTGLAHYDPDSPCAIDDLIRQADELMYIEKRNHKRLQITRFSPQRDIERRTFKRYPARGKLEVELDNISRSIKVDNISLGGIRFQTSERINRKKFHRIKAKSVCGSAEYKGIIVRSDRSGEPDSHGDKAILFDVGLRFIGLSNRDKQSLVSFISGIE